MRIDRGATSCQIRLDDPLQVEPLTASAQKIIESVLDKGGRQMFNKKKSLLVFVMTILSLIPAVPALAAAPQEGLVVEGERVPGIEITGLTLA